MDDNEKEFEKILDRAVDKLETTVKVAPQMDSGGFEDSAFKAIQEAAKGTVFEGEIDKTSKGAFPDIICKRHYGVEVKQVLKDSSSTRGNSIFEKSRVEGIQKIYLVMFWHARKAGTGKVAWRRYQDIIKSIVITHSPRYLLDVRLSDGENLFERIGVSYDEFRQLSQDEMMKHVRGLYEKNGHDKNLWWFERQDREPLRFLKSASDAEHSCLIGETFFLCPQIFGKNQQKFDAVVAYWLSRGFVCHALRDEFSSGGQETLDNVKVPRIVYHASCTQRDDIIRAAQTLKPDIIQQFWELESDDKVPPPNKRIQEWLCLVRKHSRDEPEVLEVLERAFNNS